MMAQPGEGHNQYEGMENNLNYDWRPSINGTNLDADEIGTWTEQSYADFVDATKKKKRKNKSSKIPNYPIGPMFGSRPIDSEEEASGLFYRPPNSTGGASASIMRNSQRSQPEESMRWSESSSPEPVITPAVLNTLSRPLPHNVGTRQQPQKNIREFDGQFLHWQESESSDSEDCGESFFSGRNSVANNGNNASMVANGPAHPSSTTMPNCWEGAKPAQIIQRAGSQLSLQTALTSATNSSFTIVSDPHLAQFVENARPRNIFEEEDGDDDGLITGLEDIDRDHHRIVTPTLANDRPQQQTAPPPPTSSICSSSVQTGSTLHQPVPAIPISSFSSSLPRNPLQLDKELGAFQQMATKMSLHFQIRHDEGAISFSHPPTRRILVLTSVMCGEVGGTQGETIRVSLHTNGRLYRETHLRPIEKWLGLPALEGLCNRFFIIGDI